MAEQYTNPDDDAEEEKEQPKKAIPKKVVEGIISWDDEGRVRHDRVTDAEEIRGIRERLLRDKVVRAEVEDEDETSDDDEDNTEVVSDEALATEMFQDSHESSDGIQEASVEATQDNHMPDVAEILAAKEAADKRWEHATSGVELPLKSDELSTDDEIELPLEPVNEMQPTEQMFITPDIETTESEPQTTAPENQIEDTSHHDGPDYSAAPSWSEQREQSVSNPPEREAVEVVASPKRGLGLLSILLGAEFLARRRADRQQAESLKNYVDEKVAELPRVQPPVEAQPLPSPSYGPLVPHTPEVPPTAAQAEVLPEGQNVANQQEQEPVAPSLKEGQHIEHSAWHNVVVDRHGREVADAIEYGQGFHQEQQEVRRDQDAASQTPAASMPSSTTSTATSTIPVPALPSGMVINELPSGTIEPTDVAHQLPAHAGSPSSGISMAWIVTMVVIIVLAYFVTALL